MTPAALRAARAKLGLTHTELGTALGYGGSHADRGQKISDMECGRRRIHIRASRLVEMFVVHGVPPAYLDAVR